MLFYKLRFFITGIFVALVFSAKVSSAPSPNSEYATPNTETNSQLQLLNARDVTLYQQIFELQENGLWQQADTLIEQITDPILMGHVLFQRYMHPTAYRSKYSELRDWMQDYADLPDAYRIYRLAMRRRGGAAAPRRVVPAPPLGGRTDVATPPPQRTQSEQRDVRTARYRIIREIRRGEPGRAEKRLWALGTTGLLTDTEFDDLLTDVASSYYFEGNDKKAWALASLAAERSAHAMSQPDWVAGLAAWRMGNYGQSETHFLAVSNSANAGEWIASAGAYWAARATVKTGKPDKTTPLLRKAATYKYTFYGMLAATQLGMTVHFDWTRPEYRPEDQETLGNQPAVARAMALTQIGWTEMADTELRMTAMRMGFDSYESLIRLAAQLDLPSTQAILSKELGNDYALPDSVRYPLPEWQPEGGFLVDRAVIYGFMRQESEFMPRARSVDGAMGLLQLMPTTASFISGDRSLRRSGSRRLFEPALNMQLGQKYMMHLLEANWTEGDMFKLAAAYNGGPGNLTRWRQAIEDIVDPLLFIESLPALETRIFIERVFSNLWIYRARLGQPAPSLEIIAAGAWAPYEPVDLEQADQIEGPVASLTGTPINVTP